MSPAEQSALEGLLGRPLTQAELDQLTPCFGFETRNDVVITALLSGWRTRIVPTLVGEGVVSNAIGVPDGPVFMRSLRLAAEAELPAEATTEEVVQKALVEEAWRHLCSGTLNLGLPAVRTKIDAMVGVLPFTQEQADAVKALAVAQHPFALREVSWALNDAEGIPQP